jgi:hypothetical protein
LNSDIQQAKGTDFNILEVDALNAQHKTAAWANISEEVIWSGELESASIAEVAAAIHLPTFLVMSFPT